MQEIIAGHIMLHFIYRNQKTVERQTDRQLTLYCDNPALSGLHIPILCLQQLVGASTS